MAAKRASVDSYLLKPLESGVGAFGHEYDKLSVLENVRLDHANQPVIIDEEHGINWPRRLINSVTSCQAVMVQLSDPVLSRWRHAVGVTPDQRRNARVKALASE
jgi:hypothetical protein